MRLASFPPEVPRNLFLRGSARGVLGIALWGALLFGSAGTISWSRGWLHLCLWCASFSANLLLLLAKNPDVLAARLAARRFPEAFDRMLALWVMTPAMLAIPVVAGLDAVLFDIAPLPPWTIFPALALHVAGDAFAVRAMIENPFLERVVRIQSERGHHVVTTGPYAIVRHPMYAGTLLMVASIPLFLGSGLALLPAVVVALALLLRTRFEDRFLRVRLPGYEEYSRKVRYRLIPGVW